MEKSNFKIEKYTDKYHEQVLDVWEKSVLATHDFLDPSDFQTIKSKVKELNFHDYEVYCLVRKDEVVGFLGTLDRKIEMLFLSPDYMGKGHGKTLMTFAINELNVDKVDVNEQNKKAVAFYERWGFITYERTKKDDQGNDHPLLRMKIETSHD